MAFDNRPFSLTAHNPSQLRRVPAFQTPSLSLKVQESISYHIPISLQGGIELSIVNIQRPTAMGSLLEMDQPEIADKIIRRAEVAKVDTPLISHFSGKP